MSDQKNVYTKPTYDELITGIEGIAEYLDDSPPRTPEECDLMILLWRHNGDRTEPCEGCDGECGEGCAPTTAANVIAQIEAHKKTLK